MQVFNFSENLDDWQGTSLIFGVVEVKIESQLEQLKFLLTQAHY